MSVVKTPEQLEAMEKAAVLLSECLDFLVAESKPGVTAADIDHLAEEFIKDHGAVPAFKNYQNGLASPYPASVCFSKNYILVHGVPSSDTRVEEGDIITIDCGLSIDGWFADAARLFAVGDVPPETQTLLDASHAALAAGIDQCRPGNHLGDVQHAIQRVIANSGFGNVYQFCGHAIGRKMHEEPQVPNYGKRGQGIILEPGMVFCLEPMLLANRKAKLGVLPDGWTIVTTDGSLATHVEHMVAVTEGEPKVLTLSRSSDRSAEE